MKLKRLDPPAKRSQKLVSLYDQLITPEMVRMARAHPGETFAPVVVAGGEHWSGFRPDKIKALAVLYGYE